MLVVESGDVVHNLRAASFAEGGSPCAWALRFNDFVRSEIAGRGRRNLIDYRVLGRDAQLSIPTTDRHQSLPYVLGAPFDDEMPAFFNDEVALASVSMLGVVMGHPQPGASGLLV